MSTAGARRLGFSISEVPRLQHPSENRFKVTAFFLLSPMESNSIHPGRLHRINRPAEAGDLSPAHPLVAFEHTAGLPREEVPNTLIFLGGLFDGPLTVPYVPPLVSALDQKWRLVEPILASAYKQSGFSSLNGDVVEIAQLVAYFRKLRPHGKVVLLGHSTGSQMIMHYLLKEGEERPRIDGGIMQASASDREILLDITPAKDYQRACETAQKYVQEGKEKDILPFELTKSSLGSAPISARRWLSLANPVPGHHQGEDDYFSSDLSHTRLQETFTRLGVSRTRLAFLFSGEDEYVPSSIDKHKMVSNWEEYIRRVGGVVDQCSGVVDGASHTLKEGGKGQHDLVRRTLGFLERCQT